MHKFYIAVFRKGQPLFRLGHAFTATHEGASFLVDLIEASNPPLIEGDYIAYDYCH